MFDVLKTSIFLVWKVFRQVIFLVAPAHADNIEFSNILL